MFYCERFYSCLRLSDSVPSHNMNALVVVADGTEELEFAAAIDVLGCAGVKVDVASVMPEKRLPCKMARGITITADHHISDPAVMEKNFDIIIVPGGIPGASNCAMSDDLVKKLKHQKSRGGWYAAICAAPSLVFFDKGIVESEKMVCYEYKDFTVFSDPLRASGNMSTSSDRVVIDGKCITSVGPGSAMEFALVIVECLLGKEKATEVAQGMLIRL
jgi:protein deglycase